MMHLLSHMLAEVHFRSVNKKFQHTVEWLSDSEIGQTVFIKFIQFTIITRKWKAQGLVFKFKF